MSNKLEVYIPICDAIAQLLWPHGEAVIHNLKTGTIFYIANSYSKRRIGDSSLNETDGMDFSLDIIGPYGKTNWNGHRLKSVTTVLKDGRGKPIGLLCINNDVEAFAGLKEQLLSLIEIPVSAPTGNALLAKDWRENINLSVAEFLKWRGTTLAGLNSADTDDLIRSLDDKQLFDIRNAVPYTAEILKVSRATIYNRLKITRKVKTQKVKH